MKLGNIILIMCFVSFALGTMTAMSQNGRGETFPISEMTHNEIHTASAYNIIQDPFIVVWEDDRNGNPDIYGRIVNADGSFAGQEEVSLRCGVGKKQNGGAKITLALHDCVQDVHRCHLIERFTGGDGYDVRTTQCGRVILHACRDIDGGLLDVSLRGIMVCVWQSRDECVCVQIKVRVAILSREVQKQMLPRRPEGKRVDHRRAEDVIALS